MSTERPPPETRNDDGKTDDWDERVARFWATVDESKPDEALAGMRTLLGERPDGDARALYEWGSIHDALGREREAIPCYRAAIEAGLDREHEPQAIIQLASSLRNVGEPEAAVALLETARPTAATGDAARAFLALALHDAGRATEAVQVALLALAPALPRPATHARSGRTRRSSPCDRRSGGTASGASVAAVDVAGSSLSDEQRRILSEWFPAHRVVADHSWGLVGTFVLEVVVGSERIIVKAADEHDHHLAREVRAHREWLAPWTSIGRAPELLRADVDARIIATRYLPGRLVQGDPAEQDPDTFRQAGSLLALLHAQHPVIDPEYPDLVQQEVLSRFEQPHRMSKETVRAARAAVETWSLDPVELVPTHGDWQPRNWLVHDGRVSVIDFGRADLRPALSDFVRLQSRCFTREADVEEAFLEGYGADPRDATWWPRERLRAAIGTAVWAYAVGDEAFEAEGRREAAELLGTVEP